MRWMVERDWVQVSHEMAAMVGAGALPQRPWPAEPVALSYTLGCVGTPATVRWHADPSAATLGDDQLLLIVSASAIERLFGALPEGRDGAFHITRELREIALAIRDCDMPEGAREGSVAKIVKLEHAWRRLDGRNDDGFQVAPFPG